MKDYSDKKLEELSFDELQELQAIVDDFPIDVVVNVQVDGDKLEDISEVIYDLTEEFFEVDDGVYESIVGKCFIDNDHSHVVKVLGLNKGLNKSRAEYEDNYEFIYEHFYLNQSYKRPHWELPDYIWLQETANCYEAFKSYCLSDIAEMNIAAESMFHVGKDGALYVNVDCGNIYEKYSEVDEYLFMFAKNQATDKGTKTYELNS